MRKRHSAGFKSKVALEAIKGEKTVNEIASEYGIHPQQVRNWKRELLKKAHLVFESPKDGEKLKRDLEKAYKKIGQLEGKRDFLSGILKRY